MKKTFLWIVILLIIIGSAWFAQTKRATSSDVSKTSQEVTMGGTIESIPEKPIIVAKVQVDTPLVDAKITSPLTISGKARGPWYFEASFPIELRDSNNVVIASTTAQAQGEWMTEDWVPFTATLTFPAQPAGSSGKIILKKDNPSGLPEKDESVEMAVQF